MNGYKLKAGLRDCNMQCKNKNWAFGLLQFTSKLKI
jgi:hypothetical protein